MIVWSGLGVLVIVIVAVVGGAVAALVGAVLGTAPAEQLGGLGFGLGGLAAAAVNWLVGRRLNSGAGRVLLDPATGQQVVLRRRHSLFFIPMQWWSVPIAAISVVMLMSGLFGKPQPAPADTAPARARPL